jgi:hypothetical protein
MSLNSVITEDKIEKAVRKVKHGKTPGYDNVLNEHILSTLPIFLHVYKIFFSISFLIVALFQMSGFLEL